MANFVSNEWYTVEFTDGSESTFKFLDTVCNPDSIAYNVELCNGKREAIVLKMHTNIIQHGLVSPCKKV